MFIIILGELNGAKVNISQANVPCFYHGYTCCVVTANFNAVALRPAALALKELQGSKMNPNVNNLRNCDVRVAHIRQALACLLFFGALLLGERLIPPLTS